MKKILITIFLSINFIALSQVNVDKKILKEVENLNINSESQIMDELKKRGMTLEDAKKLAQIQGVNLEDLILNMSKKPEQSKQVDELPNAILSNIENNSEKNESKRFGEYFFNNKNISETPNLFLATPNDYRLGPGDQLIINLFGALENTYSLEISREGSVKFDRIPPVFLSGLHESS